MDAAYRITEDGIAAKTAFIPLAKRQCETLG